MLPAPARLRRRGDFTATLRDGRRAARSTVVLTLARHGVDDPAGPGPQRPTPQVGFAVSRPVGGAVTRNRITRRLRHVMRDRLGRLAPGDRLVVRARPAAATADYQTLERDVDAALDRLLGGS